MSEIKHRIHLAENFFPVLSIDPLFIYFSMSVTDLTQALLSCNSHSSVCKEEV